MKKRIPYVIFLVSLLSLTVLCGCDKSTKSAQEKQEKTENQEQVTKEETDRKKNNTINLYYLNAQEDGFKKVSCKLQHSDDLKEMKYSINFLIQRIIIPISIRHLFLTELLLMMLMSSEERQRLILELVTFNCPIRRKCCLEHRL